MRYMPPPPKRLPYHQVEIHPILLQSSTPSPSGHGAGHFVAQKGRGWRIHRGCRERSIENASVGLASTDHKSGPFPGYQSAPTATRLRVDSYFGTCADASQKSCKTHQLPSQSSLTPLPGLCPWRIPRLCFVVHWCFLEKLGPRAKHEEGMSSTRASLQNVVH